MLARIDISRKGLAMKLVEEIERIAARDGMGAALAAVEESAMDGNVEGLALLGEWRLWGIGGIQSVVEGRALIERAATQGDERATKMLVGLLNNGTGGARDPERARALTEEMAIDCPRTREQLTIVDALPRLDQPTTIREAPHIAHLDNFFSAEACDYLIEKAMPKMQPSFVVDPHTGARRPHPVRSSDGTNFAPHEEDLVLNALNERIAAVTGTTVAQGEPLHALRYRGAQQYRPHMDALPGVGNQRILTAILYLNDNFGDGETLFTRRAVQVRPRRGRLLFFANTEETGAADRLSEHAGLPVTQGEKWIVTRWIRGSRFHPWEPDTAR